MDVEHNVHGMDVEHNVHGMDVEHNVHGLTEGSILEFAKTQ
jgi:hypothetical protein